VTAYQQRQQRLGGAIRNNAEAIRFTRPGTTTALPAASPSIPACATLSAGSHMIRGRAASASSLLKPAASPNPVSTGPGHSAVAVTPVPRSSPRRLWV